MIIKVRDTLCLNKHTKKKHHCSSLAQLGKLGVTVEVELGVFF